MSSGFVKTSMLEGGDNSLGDEIRLETDDVKRQEFRNAQAAARPLYEQLEEQREKKEAEYDATTKAMFAPTKALDEEEAQHMNDVEDRKHNNRMLQKTQEDREMDEYKFARLSRTTVVVADAGGGGGGSGSGNGSGSGSGNAAPASMRFPPAVPRAAALDVKTSIKRKPRLPAAGSVAKSAKDAKDAAPVAPAAAPAVAPGVAPGRRPAESESDPLAALGGYGSDSDSDSG
jgi:hypothetical protein